MDTPSTTPSKSKHRLIAGVVSFAFVLGVVAIASPRFLTGSLLPPTDIAFLLKERADKDGDFLLTAREIRKELATIIRDVILQKTEGDINGDGVTNRADISASIAGFRALLTATCGNFIVEAGEQCDDDTDDCSNVCRTVVHVGNLFVTKAVSPSGARQVLGGTDVPVLGLNFKAEREDISVTGLQISFENDVRSVDRLSVAIAGQTFHGTTGQCGTDTVPAGTFCFDFGNDGFVVSSGDTYNLPISMVVRTDVLGGQAGDVVIPRLDTVVTNAATSNGTVRARGVTSNAVLSMNDADSTADGEIFIGTAAPAADAPIVGDHHQIVMSKITGITNAHSNQDGTPILVDEFAAGRFQIAAAAHANTQNGLNSVSPKDMIIDVHAPNVQLDPNGFFISNDSEDIRYACTPRKNTLELITTPAEATGDFHLECTSTDNPLSINVDQGSTNVFKVIVNVMNAQVNPEQTSELRVFLQNVSDYANQQTDNFSYDGSHFRWVDMDSAGASTTFIWVDGASEIISGPLYQLAPIGL